MPRMSREHELAIGDALAALAAAGPAATLPVEIYADPARHADELAGEDLAVADDVQAKIDAGAVTELRLGRTERAIVAHLAGVDRLIGDVS